MDAFRERFGQLEKLAGGGVVNTDLERMRESDESRQCAALVNRLLHDLGPRYGAGRVTLQTYRVYAGSVQQGILDRCRSFANQLDQLVRDSVNLLWYGSWGTGKDHLAAALLYMATSLHQIEARWVTAEKIFQSFREGITLERIEVQTLRQYTEPLILCISDPLPNKGELSAWDVRILKRILDDRTHACRPTWGTVNAKDQGELEYRLTPAVWDRWRDNAELLECKWRSHRRERGS